MLCVVSERGLTQSRMAVTRTCENRTSCDMPLTASTKYTYSVTHCTRLPSPAMARRSGLTPRHATPRHATPRHATPIACTHADAACGAQPHGSVPTGHGGVCSRWLPTATGRLAGVQSLHTLHKVCAGNFRVWEASGQRGKLRHVDGARLKLLDEALEIVFDAVCVDAALEVGLHKVAAHLRSISYVYMCI